MALVAVAALFSAGTWWGMEFHGKAAINKVATASLAAANSTRLAPAVTTPAQSANVPSLASSDNLMSPSKLGSSTTPITAVAEDKLTAMPKITGVRHWSSSIGSTLVIDMEDQVPYEVHRLISPERIYFDLHDTVLAPELVGKTIEVGDPSLTRVRVAQPVAGVTRVVLDTQDGSNFSVSMESNPYRLVVELGGGEKTAVANKSVTNQVTSNADAPNQVIPSQVIPRQSIPNQDTAKQVSPNQTSTSLNRAPLPGKANSIVALAAKVPDQPLPTGISPMKTSPATPGRFRIVLDPGHGGWDLGTVGRQGLLEKDLVLDVTQRLGKLLQARLGTEVMFTRTDDTYLPLDQRADLANHAQADLLGGPLRLGSRQLQHFGGGAGRRDLLHQCVFGSKGAGRRTARRWNLRQPDAGLAIGRGVA
jgi:N-acetylmuramoyl-L-alanine amidase